ncbi:DEAD/DEAH box helicase [Salarchaeum japonicum]|uniref:DEAD/DEAH box helicase n=1 Tax=Salarchaeum japonicum TaxID=555573 RepID=UPI003C711032
MSGDSPGRPRALTESDALSAFDDTEVPFVTTHLVAEREGCSIATARKVLDGLVGQGEIDKYRLDDRRTLYFRTDYGAANDLVTGLRKHLDLTGLDIDSLEAFAENPYKLLPKSNNEYYLVVPKFIPFHVGHLHEQDGAWQVFIINKYVSWIEELPDEILDQVDVGQRFDEAEIKNNILTLSSEEEREDAWSVLGGREGGLHKRVGDNKIQIQKGSEFKIIAELIEHGNLPFSADPIVDSDLRGEPENVDLRSYQQTAWEKFTEYGKVGIYWPPGTGKTFLALYAGERIAGEKLVVVPTATLEQQWEDRIRKFCEAPEEWSVKTYQYLTYGNNIQEYMGSDAPSLFIADECHRLPADTFSKLATINSTYRIGLSASPYREDERTDYIFALTGFPVGIDWQSLVELGVVDYPDIRVYLYQDARQKRDDLLELVNQRPGKGLIFCDSLEKGASLADELEIPFVSGDTAKQKRRKIIDKNRISIVSRVGDEGLSIEDLDWTIEYQFHGSSRRQELQRTGRIMHTNSQNPQHIIQLTDSEMAKFSERLHSLEEKGMNLQFERRS